MVTDDSGLNPTGSYQIVDSKDSLNVVNGTYTINPDGSFSFSVDIDRSNSGPNNPGNRRYYTFTLTATDVYGNIGTATAQFYIQ
jgi:VCBS repeat-containing protein